MKIKTFCWMLMIMCGLFLNHCKNVTPPSEKTLADSLDVSLDSETIEIKYNNSTYSLPSPHQASLIIKNNNIDFNPDFINDTEKADNYLSTIKKALNLGIYGTDLGYLNLHQRTQESLNYYNTILRLSKELKVIDAMDMETLLSMENNLDNSDSLIFYLSASFAEINYYLRKNDRDHIGALMIAGGWIESLYIVSQYYLQKNNPILFSYLGEQKYPLDNLIRILEPYYGRNEEFSLLFDDFVNLAYIFDNIEFQYEVIEKQTFESQKLTVIKNTSEIEAFDEILTEVAKEISAIRNRIVE